VASGPNVLRTGNRTHGDTTRRREIFSGASLGNTGTKAEARARNNPVCGKELFVVQALPRLSRNSTSSSLAYLNANRGMSEIAQSLGVRTTKKVQCFAGIGYRGG